MTPQEFGELIRIRREAQRLTIEDLALRFKLSASTLRAIEEGNLDRLPHIAYARGFVRSYAQAVGVSPEELDAGIDAVFPQQLFDDVSASPGPISIKPTRMGRGGGDKLVRLALVLVFLALPLGAGWFVINNYGDAILDLIKRPLSAAPFVPDSESSPSVSEPVAVSPGRVVSGQAGVEQPASEFSAPIPRPPAMESDARTALPESVQNSPPATHTEPLTIAGKHISIQAREECWVQVTVDGEGTRSFTVYPGETSVLPYSNKISMVLGNAGGVSITHNGKPFEMSGKQNERRSLVFQ